jgi:Protein of unknown function (DUF2958)
MKLLTEALRKKLPPIKSTENQKDPMVIAKFFTPWTGWTWWAIEGSPTEGGDFEFFGLVDGLEKELGYFSLRELESIRGPGGLTIERDLYWEPCRLSELQRGA